MLHFIDTRDLIYLCACMFKFKIMPAILPNILGDLDIDTEGDTHKILSTIKLPFGNILIDDSFTMEDVFHIKNDLHIGLTFSKIREITSSYNFVIDLDDLTTYFMEMSVNVRKQTTWIEVAFLIYFGISLFFFIYIIFFYINVIIYDSKNIKIKRI